MSDDLHYGDVDRVAGRAVEALNSLFGEAAPGMVFSEPTQVGEDLVITAAAWERAGGFGFGGGGGTDNQGNLGGGSGGGGGGGSQGRPVAVIRISSRGVDVTPVLDFTKITVTLLLGALGVWRALKK